MRTTLFSIFKKSFFHSTLLSTARNMHAFLRFLKRYLTVRPNSQRIGHCTVYCITFLSQHESFLIKIVQNFEELVDDFFNVTGDSLLKKTRPSSLNLSTSLVTVYLKKSAIQLKSYKAMTLKYFKYLCGLKCLCNP